MTAPFAARFGRLEIPADKRHPDWSFLEEPLTLPQPLPFQDASIAVFVNGRVLMPTTAGAGAPDGTGRGQGTLILYDLRAELGEADPPAVAEGRYADEHAEALAQARRRFLDRIPASVLTSDDARREVQDLLSASRPRSNAAHDLRLPGFPGESTPSLFIDGLIGHSRLLRLHTKLYDLLTLTEYARIFEKAIEPTFFATLARMPERTTPQELLTLIEGNLSAIHARARSPLRNKIDSSRVELAGITLLPIYAGQTRELWAAYDAAWQVELELQALDGSRR